MSYFYQITHCISIFFKGKLLSQIKQNVHILFIHYSNSKENIQLIMLTHEGFKKKKKSLNLLLNYL